MEHFGKVAKCKAGKIGVITDIKYYRKGIQVVGYMTDEYKKNSDKIYFGVSLDGSRWQSKEPKIIANSIIDFIDDAFEGIKMR